jgi:DNA mismatch repair protein MutS2
VAEEDKPIQWTVDAIADLDLAFAKAKYADALLASQPQFADPKAGKRKSNQDAASHPIRLLSACHPLLDPQTVVPVTMILPPETSILIITGPNTGGKTVTLKTIGLLAAMAQAGLHIPADEGSTLPVFDNIYADIGDEQSIEQSLSTFSSHLTNIVGILDQCDAQSLVLLDELGAGTDPVEGSALARAILEHLRAKQVITFVATHYSELKAYAHSTPGVVNASMEFDVDTLAPTFRLAIGLPGRSNAFAIARRLGLNGGIVETAEDMVSPESVQTEAMLSDIQAQLDAAAEERRAAEKLRAQVEARLDELTQRLAQVDAERRDILNQARADARSEIKSVRQELRRLREQWLAQGSPVEEMSTAQELEKESEESLAALESTVAQDEVPPPPEPVYRGPLHPGDQVWVEPYQAEGEVVSSRRGKVEVQLGSFRASVKRNQVELRQAADSQDVRSSKTQTPSVESPGIELDLRGQTSEEALLELDRYLDDAYLTGLPWVRIIHGKGTGALRAAVRDALGSHPLVAACEPGKEGEGGDGVTVARLKVE